MAYKQGSVTKSAITATTDDDKIDVTPYKSIAIQAKFATCTGTSNTSTLKMQTSNDGENWADCTPTLASETDAADLNGDNYFQFLPDGGTTNEFGFGKYIRFTFTGSGTFSVSYTITYLLRD
jgi:hypothetical protein